MKPFNELSHNTFHKRKVTCGIEIGNERKGSEMKKRRKEEVVYVFRLLGRVSSRVDHEQAGGRWAQRVSLRLFHGRRREDRDRRTGYGLIGLHGILHPVWIGGSNEDVC